MNLATQIIAKRVDAHCDVFINRKTAAVFLLTWNALATQFTLYCNGVRMRNFPSRRDAITKLEAIAK